MLSVIIPVYNDQDSIGTIIAYVYANSPYKRLLKEVIVVDGGSTDATVAEAEKTGATVMICPSKERVNQLNFGARQATGNILYFLHPNSLPPKNFIGEIVKACSKGYACGTFSLKFTYQHWMLSLLSWFTKHDSGIHLSDQSLFLTKELFDKSGGFREDHLVMANQEMIKRLKRYTDFIVLKDSIMSSAGKYLRSGIFRTEIIQAVVFCMHRLGYQQKDMIKLYRKWLGWKFGIEKKSSEQTTISIRKTSADPKTSQKKVIARN
jgi:rSAM/selenodomain-associated transferase 2